MIDPLRLTILNHRLMDIRLLFFFFFAFRLSVRLKVNLTVLKLRNEFEYSSEKGLRMLQFIDPLSLFKLMIQFDTLIPPINNFQQFLTLLEINSVDTLHLSITNQLQLVISLLRFISLSLIIQSRLSFSMIHIEPFLVLLTCFTLPENENMSLT